MDVRIGWAAFDAAAAPMEVRVGWAEFDAIASPFAVFVGWAELDARSPTNDAVPPFVSGGGVARYHSSSSKQYEIPVLDDEAEDEEIILSILTEIAAHVLI